MDITCPVAGNATAVVSTGGGPAGTICVQGTFSESGTDGQFIRIRILSGDVDPPFAPPDPMQAGDVDVTPVGTSFCTTIAVSDSSDTGVPFTVVGWYNPGGGGSFGNPVSVQFLAGGADPMDCCVGCVSASGTGTGSGSGNGSGSGTGSGSGSDSGS